MAGFGALGEHPLGGVPIQQSVAATGVAAGAPVLATPSLTQVHVLAATGVVAGTPDLDSPEISQAHSLEAADLDADAHVLDSPEANEANSLQIVDWDLSSHVLDEPVITQAHSLLANDLAGGTRTNLITYSEQLDNAAWTKAAATVSANATTAPDGETTADKVVEDSSTGGHLVLNPAAVLANSLYTASVHLKAAENSFALVVLGGAFAATGISVNLSTGAVAGALGSPLNIDSVDEGDGWWRVSFSLLATSTANGTLSVYLSEDGVWANRSYAGDGSSGIYVWGAQLEAGNHASEYIQTTSAAVSVTGDMPTPALTQVHALLADNLDSSLPVLAEPVLTQVSVLLAENLDLLVHVLDSPVYHHIYNLVPTDLDAEAHVLDEPDVIEAQSLVADGFITGVPTLDEPVITQVHALLADALIYGPYILEIPAFPTGIFAHHDSEWKYPDIYAKHESSWKLVTYGYRRQGGDWVLIYAS